MIAMSILPRIKRMKFIVAGFSSKKYTLPNQANQVPLTALNESELEESFVRGSGPGGQKINKSKNNVFLVHVPTGISVQCQETRDLSSNRKIARKLLRDKLDLALNGENSKLGKRFERIRKKKRNSARRAAKKYGPGDVEAPESSTDVDDENNLDDSFSDDDSNEDEIHEDDHPK